MGLNRNLGQLTEALTESSGNVLLNPNNTVGGTNVYIGQTMASNDTWRIYGNTIATDRGEMVFELGDNASASSANGQRFRFFYNATDSGTSKSPFILDYNDAIFDTNASFSGNVGIGTETPNAKLDVRGELFFPNISTVDGTNVISFSEVTDKAFAIKAYLAGSGATGNKMGIGSNIAGWASNIMTWRGDGNVGIGTTSPSGKLHVKRGASEIPLIIDSSSTSNPSYTQYRVNNSSGWEHGMAGVGDSYKYLFSYGDFGTTNAKMTLTSGGNIGIGTTSPAQKLTIGNGTGTGNQYIRIHNSASDIYIGQTESNLLGAGNGQVIVTDSTYTSNLAIGTLSNSANLIFGTGNTERMRIYPTGNVFIGPSPSDNGTRLRVNGSISATSLALSGNYNTTISTNTNWTSFQTIIPTGVLDAYGVYIISARWTNNGGGNPWEVMCSFIFTPVATNGGGVENEIVPLMSTHTGSTGATMTFRSRAASQSVSGLEVKFTTFGNINGIIFISAIKIQQT
jgi:hypothetical protein